MNGPRFEHPPGPAVTKKQREVLEYLASQEGEDDLIVEGREVWYGYNRTNWPLFLSLLRLVFIRPCDEPRKGFNGYYGINESGRRYLEGKPPYTDANGRHHWTMTACTMADVRIRGTRQ